MQKTITTGGFTLIEVLVVIAIIIIIATIAMGTFKNLYTTSTYRAGGSELYGALTSARNNTLASQNSTVFGVRISTTTVTRFVGPTFIPASTTNQTYLFEGGVTATSSIIGNGVSIVFARLTGKPSATGTIYVRSNESSGTSTIIIHASGLIEYK